MKKTVLFMAVLAMTASANAASINWSVSGAPAGLATYYEGGTYASAPLYFIVANDLSGLTSTTQLKADFLNNLSAITLTTATATELGKKPTISQQPVSSALLTAGTPTLFGLMYFSEDAAGNGYYKIATAGANPYSDGAPLADHTGVITSFSTMTGSGWTQAYAVPEPATAALALAGLAMLIRRRK